MTSEYDLNPAPTPISLDSQGRFEIPFWPQNVDCRIQVKIGFVSMDAAPIRPDAREPHREVALELPKRRDVDVRVVDPEGRPIPDAPVTVVLDPQGIDKRWKAGRTDVDGRISLQGLADGPRDYRLEFDFEDDFVPMLIALNPGRSEAVVQARHGRTVQGQVVEAVTGLPISKVRLTALQAADDDPSVSTTTDADGRFRFTNLPAGVVKLVVDSNPATVIFVNGASSGEFSTDVDGPILVELLNLTRRFFEEQSE